MIVPNVSGQYYKKEPFGAFMVHNNRTNTDRTFIVWCVYFGREAESELREQGEFHLHKFIIAADITQIILVWALNNCRILHPFHRFGGPSLVGEIIYNMMHQKYKFLTFFAVNYDKNTAA